MESWNDGIEIFKSISSILNVIVGLNFATNLILQFPKPQLSNIPAFQRFSGGEAPWLGVWNFQQKICNGCRK
jgi:hypothetical protein